MTTLDLPLFATPETRRALAEAHAVAILVGSYDGSGNFGDIAQLDAGLRLLKALEPGLLVLPVLERIHLRGHEELLATFQCPPRHALFFDPEHAGQDDLLPVAVPPGIAAAAIYLYGGGYLNPSWGARKLAMVRVGEDLLQAAGVERVTRLSSGLQVDQGWLEDLAPDDDALLRSFELLGARDPLSARAFAGLGSTATVVDTGDDALGAIPILAPSDEASEAAAGLDVNLHFGGHQWVSGRPEELRDYTLDFLTELGRRAGRTVRIHPLIAYMDSRIDERPGTADLVGEGARRGIEAEEPRLMRPATLAGVLPELRGATATISCSYHVALTSLLLGIPTVFFADNPYYVQKAAGLLTAFGLPASFALSPGADLDPVITAILDGGASMRAEIARHGAEFRRRRADAERELLGRLAGGVLAELAVEVGRSGERLRQRSTEPAGLQVDAAALRTEVEELRRPAVQAAVEAAERAAERAQEAARLAEERAGQAAAENAAAHQRLAEVFGSRTWKLAAPLRRLGAALRRLKRRGR
jgi:polysaccharide pyruvyl transferase WcaK-like protein